MQEIKTQERRLGVSSTQVLLWPRTITPLSPYFFMGFPIWISLFSSIGWKGKQQSREFYFFLYSSWFSTSLPANHCYPAQPYFVAPCLILSWLPVHTAPQGPEALLVNDLVSESTSFVPSLSAVQLYHCHLLRPPLGLPRLRWCDYGSAVGASFHTLLPCATLVFCSHQCPLRHF